MTVLGKIFVFMNLVFSLVTAGLIVMVYTTRTNWNDAYKKVLATNTVVRAQADADVQAAKDETAAKEKQVQALNRNVQELQAQVKAETAKADGARAELNTLRQTQIGSQTNVQGLTEELSRRKTEVENLQRLLGERDKKISEIDHQMALLRDEAVRFRVQWEQARDRNNSLLQQVEALTREVAQLRAQLGGGATTTAGGQQVVPKPEDLRGTIQRVEGDLATITPGSDAGVAVDQELTVFRLHPRPEYLGRIRILSVSPHEAVGRLIGPKKAQIKKGDEIKP
jgi:hypothetical protein